MSLRSTRVEDVWLHSTRSKASWFLQERNFLDARPIPRSAVADAVDELSATFSPSSLEFLRKRGAEKLKKVEKRRLRGGARSRGQREVARGQAKTEKAPLPAPPGPECVPTTDAELAAACARLPESERVKLDWTAEATDADDAGAVADRRARSLGARRGAAV